MGMRDRADACSTHFITHMRAFWRGPDGVAGWGVRWCSEKSYSQKGYRLRAQGGGKWGSKWHPKLSPKSCSPLSAQCALGVLFFPVNGGVMSTHAFQHQFPGLGISVILAVKSKYLGQTPTMHVDHACARSNRSWHWHLRVAGSLGCSKERASRGAIPRLCF